MKWQPYSRFCPKIRRAGPLLCGVFSLRSGSVNAVQPRCFRPILQASSPPRRKNSNRAMAAGNRRPVLTHPRLDSLPVGTVLWHVHPEAFAATAFNPKSENRFAANTASPPRAMYYAGASPEVAIWETVLRDVVADKDSCVVLFKDRIEGKRLARVRTTRAIAIVDLRMPGLRRHAANAARSSTPSTPRRRRSKTAGSPRHRRSPSPTSSPRR
jgi:RES domain